MFEEKPVSTRSPSRKIVSSRPPQSSLGILSLISLLVIVASCLSGSAQARQSRALNNDEAFEELREKYEQEFYRLTSENQSPKVGQSDEYDYYVPEEAFSTTENFLKMNSFIIGAKLTDTYGSNTDLCINDVIDAVDSRAYYTNNRTLHDKETEEGLHETLFLPYLNVTGAIFGPVADALPSCYDFLYDTYAYENSRFMSFNSNWGNFFLAFLFNQMGNALNFQTKFERIQDERDRQNYAGVWQEYGDLVYLIWTFQPIDEASLESIDSFVEKWMNEHAWLDDDASDTQRTVVKTGVSTFSRYVHSAGEAFGVGLATIKASFGAKFEARNQANAEKRQAAKDQDLLAQSLFSNEEPRVRAKADNWPPKSASDGGQLVNGIFTGIVEVFPYESNQVRCKGNFTQAYDAGQSVYSRFTSDDGLQWKTTTVQKEIITDIAYLLKLPFGISHSCYWGFSTVLVNVDPMEDGFMSEDEELEERIMITNDYITNVFFNLGYMYQDIASILELLKSAGIVADDTVTTTGDIDYKNFGIYVGDILIRFVWRRRFTRNFEYSGTPET